MLHFSSRKSNRFTVIIFSLIILLHPVTSSLPTAICAEAPLTISGSAPLTSPNAHNEALHNAFRNAIEQKVGIQVSSDTRIRNAEVLLDEIYTYSEGFVERYEVIDENVDADILTLVVNVWVGENRLNKALFLNGLDVRKVYSWLGEPRVLISVEEYVDEEPSGHSFAATALENLFREKGIMVFRPDDMSPADRQDADISIDDPERAITIGLNSGAEILVLGRCLADYSRTLKIGQFEMNFYTARLYIRAFNAATGEVLLSENYSSDNQTDTSALGKSDAAAKAIANCIHTSKSDILFHIVRNWYDTFSKPMTHHVTVTNLGYDQLIKLKIKLRSLDGVRNVFERSYADRTAQLDIKYEGIQDKLAGDILASKLPCTILKKEQNLLILKHE